MAYAPKSRKYKVRWKIVAPLLVLIVLIVYAMVSLFIPEKAEEQKFTVCRLNEKDTVKLLDKKIAETYTVSDYTYYGESLGLYAAAFQGESQDELSGKTIQVHNLCTDKTVSLTMDTAVDQKITLNDLEPGFYELNVIDNLVEKRLVYDKAFQSDPFYTVKRNNHVKKVTMMADKNLLKEYNITWDANYLFLNVEKSKPQKETIDVYLDPYGMNTDFQMVPDEGNTANALTEYKEMYEAAGLMKKELEKYGLRVEISRSSVDGEAKKAYGEDGRFAVAYKKKAKYYISLRFNKSESTSMNGLEIWHSAHVSDVLGKNIVYGLQKNLDMKTSTYVDADGTGVGASAITKEYFDINIYLRETGGKATFAGLYSDLAKKENASFQNANGMNALEIDFAYVSNSEDAAFWKEHKETIVKQVANSFADAIGVGIKK